MSTPLMRIRVKYSGMAAAMAQGTGATRREMGKILKSAYINMGRFWHRDIRPKHFRNAASAEYGYAARQGEAGRPDPRGFNKSYTGKKLKREGHTRPLEDSGDSKRATGRSAMFTATGKSVRVSMPAGNLRWPHPSGRISMAGELRRISRSDEAKCARVFDRYLDSRFRRLRRGGKTVTKQTV